MKPLISANYAFVAAFLGACLASCSSASGGGKSSGHGASGGATGTSGAVGTGGSAGADTSVGSGGGGVQIHLLSEAGIDLPDGNSACTGPTPPSYCVDAAPTCGDGRIDQADEQCDDGNTVSGDGCSSTCQIEPGWECAVPNTPCTKIPRCGDGVLQPIIGETCDNGNTVSGDGCSSTCQIESGWVCPTPGQPCKDTVVCGDGVIEGNEQCDDGNTVSGDGCSSTCTLEPGYTCPMAGSPCLPKCGDGILTPPEQCDPGPAGALDVARPAAGWQAGRALVPRGTTPAIRRSAETVSKRAPKVATTAQLATTTPATAAARSVHSSRHALREGARARLYAVMASSSRAKRAMTATRPTAMDARPPAGSSLAGRAPCRPLGPRYRFPSYTGTSTTMMQSTATRTSTQARRG